MIGDWVEEHLAGEGYPRPVRKRVALLLSGLVAGQPASVSGLSRTLQGLDLSAAQEPSIARRLLRLLQDERLDPERLLPAVCRSLLARVLAGELAAHDVNADSVSPAHHARFRRLRLVVDESTDEDAAHLLVIGLWYQGLVLPLAVRVSVQNQPLGEDEWWTQLGGLLWEVHRLLPAALREHVLLVADRGYGQPRFVDLLSSLGWAWVVRLTGQVRIQLPDGTIRTLKSLVRRPTASWGASTLPDTAVPGEPVVIFKKAGWRRLHLVAVWLEGQQEPWLLVSNLPAHRDRLTEYAGRWAIERLFLTWKSHGWDLEAGRVRDVARVGRLVSGLVLATWWRLALALPEAARHLDRLAGRPVRPRQLPLPLDAAADHRPWVAKFSLWTWGLRVATRNDCRRRCPPLTWDFTTWDAPPWPDQCARAAQQAS